jgi:hypothetical protein
VRRQGCGSAIARGATKGKGKGGGGKVSIAMGRKVIFLQAALLYMDRPL